MSGKLTKYRDGQRVDQRDIPANAHNALREDEVGSPLSLIWKDWEEAGNYLSQINLSKAVAIYRDYAEGRMAKYMPDGIPKVTLPVVPSILRQKTSTICQNPVRVEYFSNRSIEASQKMTRFSDYILEQLDFQRYIKSCVRFAQIDLAAYIHAYWDEDAIGLDSIAKGAMRIERVSCLKVRVANKDVKDIQRQEWVMVASREKVNRVREMCKFKDKIDQIQPDANEFDTRLTENGGELCTVLTRYFRIDGEVYFEKACRGTMLCDPTPLNPNLSAISEEFWKNLEAEHSTSPDMEPDGETTKVDRRKWNLYPIEILSFTEMEDSYLGIPDIDMMIPGQNAINLLYSLAVQNGIDIQTKYVVKEDALGNQTITNEIGETLIDHSRGPGQGINILAGTPQMTNEMLQLPLSLIETMKKLMSTADVTMGDVSKEYSATAISLLQTAAEKPTEDMTAQKEEFVARLGRIFLLFYKFYYEDARFMFERPMAERKKFSEEYKIPLDKVPERQEGIFNGEEFMEDSFDIRVSAGPGGKMSQSTTFSWLQTFMQLAPNLSPADKRLFVQATPSYILSEKDEILEHIEEEESGIIARLTQEVQQKDAIIKSLQGGAKQLGTTVQYLQNYISEYSKESSNLIASKDAEIQRLMEIANPEHGTAKQIGNDAQKAVS